MDEIKAISLFAVIGPVCSTAVDGKKINTLIEAALQDGYSVNLDFHGVKLVTPSFYDAAVENLSPFLPEQSLETTLFAADHQVGSFSLFIARCPR